MKPGFKTVAFWGGALASLLALTFGGEILSLDGSAGKIAATIAGALGASGYTAWRRYVKPSDSTKAPIKTTEFWLTAASVLVGALYMSGVFEASDLGGKVLGSLAMILGAMGYAVPKELGAGPAPKA